MAKLGEICAFQSGGTPSKNKPEYFGGEIPWISTTALNGGKINEADAVAWITPKAIRESAAKIVPANSIMVGTRVGIGKVAINTVEMSTSQDVISLIGIDKDKWYKPYLCKLLLSKKDYFNSQARGATIKGIKIDVVANIDVPEIDYATQRKVAATLNKIDTLIVLRKQQLEKLDELIKARFVEMFGEPAANPNRYKKKKLSEIAVYFNGLTYKPENVSDEGMIVLRSSNIQNGQLDFEDVVRVDCAVKEKFVVKENDILMCSRNGSSRLVGKVALIKNVWEPMSFGAFMMIIRSDYYWYLMTYFQMASFREQIKAGTTTTINQITGRMLDSIMIPLPPVDVQNQFATFAERVDKQKQTVQQSLEKLELMKKALMQEYFG